MTFYPPFHLRTELNTLTQEPNPKNQNPRSRTYFQETKVRDLSLISHEVRRYQTSFRLSQSSPSPTSLLSGTPYHQIISFILEPFCFNSTYVSQTTKRNNQLSAKTHSLRFCWNFFPLNFSAVVRALYFLVNFGWRNA